MSLRVFGSLIKPSLRYLSTEADILHDVWPFLYRAFKTKGIKASLGGKASRAVALAKNEKRGLEARERRQRKAVGAKLDIVFKMCYNEHGSCEVGKDDVTVADDSSSESTLSCKKSSDILKMLSLIHFLSNSSTGSCLWLSAKKYSFLADFHFLS